MRVVSRSLASVAIAATAAFCATSARQARALETASNATISGEAHTPYGWADLCGRQPQECTGEVLPSVDLHLTPKTIQLLDRINTRVNVEIEPASNYDHWGTMLDHWDYPVDGKGDCKVYALWKRKLLMDLGMPRQALLMTIVRDMVGNGHTVLTVKTDRGDFVLDNMVGEIRAWDASGYSFVKRQSQTDPNVWVSFTGPHSAPPRKVSARQALDESAGPQKLPSGASGNVSGHP